MSTRFAYDPDYNPPAPSCPIVLSAVVGDVNLTVTAFLDTGADTTIMPIRHLKALGARRTFAASLRSQWGEGRKVFLYLVDIRIAELTLPGIYVVGDEIGSEVILGRNVLNRLLLLLDGPTLATVLLDERNGSS